MNVVDYLPTVDQLAAEVNPELPMTALIKSFPDRLSLIATAVNDGHAAIKGRELANLEDARKIGERLMEAKALVKHGEWIPWVRANLAFGERQAQKYIAVATNWDTIRRANTNSDSYLGTLDEAMRVIADPERPAAAVEPLPLKSLPVHFECYEDFADFVAAMRDAGIEISIRTTEFWFPSGEDKPPIEGRRTWAAPFDPVELEKRIALCYRGWQLVKRRDAET